MHNEDKLLIILEQLQKQLNELTSKVDSNQLQLNNLINKVDSNHNEIISRLDNIEALVTELDPKNAARHTQLKDEISELSKDVRFIKHALHENEEEIFHIKDHLKLVK